MLVLTRREERQHATQVNDQLGKALAIVQNAANRGRPLQATNPVDPERDEPTLVRNALTAATSIVATIMRSKDAMDGRSIGAMCIDGERMEQFLTKGYTAEHDDRHTEGELVEAAIAYLLAEECRDVAPKPPQCWPFEPERFKPSPDNRIRELAIAGAFIAAEIDRLLRLADHVSGFADGVPIAQGDATHPDFTLPRLIEAAKRQLQEDGEPVPDVFEIVTQESPKFLRGVGKPDGQRRPPVDPPRPASEAPVA